MTPLPTTTASPTEPLMTDDRRCGAPYSGPQIWLLCDEPGCNNTVLIWPRRRRDEAPLPPWRMREGDIFCPEHSESIVLTDVDPVS
jgi:hypothetical protein